MIALVDDIELLVRSSGRCGKRRVHSLFRQGCLLYDLIPNMPEQRLRPLVEKYEAFLNQNNVFTQTFGPA